MGKAKPRLNPKIEVNTHLAKGKWLPIITNFDVDRVTEQEEMTSFNPSGFGFSRPRTIDTQEKMSES